MRYLAYKELLPSVQQLMQFGGNYRIAGEKVYSIYGKISAGELSIDPFHGIPLTNHGENRIEHCIKYDLSGHTRLITIQDNGIIFLCFAGKHNDCTDWLNRNKGIRLSVNKKDQIEIVRKSSDINDSEKRLSVDSDFSDGLLFKKISNRYYDTIADGVKRSILLKFESLTSIITEDELYSLCDELENEDKQYVFFDAFTLLKNSDIDGAKRRIDLYKNDRVTLDNLSEERINQIVEGDGVIDLSNFDAELIEHLMKTMDYQQWMLFMHPDQSEIVDEDYSGETKLKGVSGSGKTAIVVRRAVRLAKKYVGEKILVLTLNRSLAKLIDELVTHVCPPQYRGSISVKSFWELCRDMLLEYEPENRKLYYDITLKTNESIEEIWKEFYHCEANNDDAKVLLPVHKSLLSREVYPFEYIKQEFDWIRSALTPEERDEYYSIERTGRSELFTKDYREYILGALNKWEQKMQFVGAVDYLGITTALMKHFSEIKPKYKSVLVDEEQDFGTIELSIIRKIVSKGENDLFLTGDFAQRVSMKHHTYAKAGIMLYGGRVKKILKNYRNSREILTAAFKVLSSNVDLGKIKDEDFELLNPEYANFATNKPLILFAPSLEIEINSAVKYLQSKLSENQKGCIAICGATLSYVKIIGKSFNIDVLDGSTSLNKTKFFLSDLEQTKGFEFDSMCIINCNAGVLPNINSPEEEWYFDVCKLYVAMTRAKKELIISYSSQLSNLFTGIKEFFVYADWEEHQTIQELHSLPELVGQSINDENDILKLTGEQFLYTKKAVGVSKELIEKILLHITGINKAIDGKVIEWKSIKDILEDRNQTNISSLFGAQKTYKEFIELFKQ